MNIEYLGLRAKNSVRSGHFGGASLGERSASHLPVAYVAIGHGDKFHMVPLLGPQYRRAARFELRVVGMRPEHYDPQLAIIRRDLCRTFARSYEHQTSGDNNEQHGPIHGRSPWKS